MNASSLIMLERLKSEAYIGLLILYSQNHILNVYTYTLHVLCDFDCNNNINNYIEHFAKLGTILKHFFSEFRGGIDHPVLMLTIQF